MCGVVCGGGGAKRTAGVCGGARPVARSRARPAFAVPRDPNGRGRVATHRHWKLTENRHDNRPRHYHVPNNCCNCDICTKIVRICRLRPCGYTK
ncbi:unnamed protein product [Arctia plantaginis]|uniref:Uncharacterized protein n=1 Tax=Arctia plantaginis TaxID=874455 RepID=A0A8S1AYW6_ARCPL|nr:unnamed protein product [Arctia plantaginis]CAB3250427.1 unnamed protein product [Arctia plantaginis]